MKEQGKHAQTRIADVVENDLCIGCGLCSAVTHGRVGMVLTPSGSLRPGTTDDFSAEEEAILTSACPGIGAGPRPEPTWIDEGREPDPIWGLHGSMVHAWAGNPEIRYEAATGGVLTALAVHLLETAQVDFVLHVGPDPERPMRSRGVISRSSAEARANAGSRYGPTAPLARVVEALDFGEPFAFIGKPCDLGALDQLGTTDDRVDALCRFRLTLVCGGQSKLTKSQALLAAFDLDEDDLALFRYRGHGNPGPTVIETKDGRTFTKTYQELWEDEASWDLETRCKLCPDPLGEAADVSAADVWPDASPSGDDAGFNGIIVRSEVGEALVANAVDRGDLVLGDPIAPREFDAFQPHQVRKKVALAARYEGMRDAGVTPLTAEGLRLEELGTRLSKKEADAEQAGTARRMRALRHD